MGWHFIVGRACMTCLPVKGLRYFKIFQRRPPSGAGARNVLYGGGHSRAQMDRRATVAVAALALLLIVSTAGCVEVKDRPERGEFTITLEVPPLMMVNTTGGWLHGPEARLTTDLESKHVEYYWGFESRLGVFPPEFDYIKGRDVQVNVTVPRIQVVSYGVEYLGQRREISIFMASIPPDSNATIAVADVDFLDTSHLPVGPSGPELKVLPGVDNQLVLQNQIGQIFNFTPYALNDTEIKVYYTNTTSRSHAYAFACNPRGQAEIAPVEAVVQFRPGEHHDIDLTPSGGLNITIRSAFGSVQYAGAVSGIPEDHRVEPGMLVWNGTVGGGKEETPGPGALITSASIAIVASAMVARRRLGLATRRAS
jgi:hypothetical protein